MKIDISEKMRNNTWVFDTIQLPWVFFGLFHFILI